MRKYRFGIWLSIIGCVLAITYFIAILLAAIFDTIPPHEPYQSIISAVSLVSVPGLVLLWVTIHESVPDSQRVFSLGSLSLMIIFGTLTSINRYISLTVIPQAMRIGVTEGLNWFQPYGWPSIMAAIEVMAWGLYLGLALFCLVPVFADSPAGSRSWLEKSIFWTLLMSGGLCLVATLGQVLNNAILNLLGILAWGPGLITLMILLAIWFKKKAKEDVALSEYSAHSGAS
jgi:hypothetical protein